MDLTNMLRAPATPAREIGRPAGRTPQEETGTRPDEDGGATFELPASEQDLTTQGTVETPPSEGAGPLRIVDTQITSGLNVTIEGGEIGVFAPAANPDGGLILRTATAASDAVEEVNLSGRIADTSRPAGIPDAALLSGRSSLVSVASVDAANPDTVNPTGETGKALSSGTSGVEGAPQQAPVVLTTIGNAASAPTASTPADRTGIPLAPRAAAATDGIDAPASRTPVPAAQAGDELTIPVRISTRDTREGVDTANLAKPSRGQGNAATAIASTARISAGSASITSAPETTATQPISSLTTSGPGPRAPLPAATGNTTQPAVPVEPVLDQQTDPDQKLAEKPNDTRIIENGFRASGARFGGETAQSGATSAQTTPFSTSAAPSTAATPLATQPASAAVQAAAGTTERAIAPQIVNAVNTAPMSRTIDVLLDPPELGRIEVVLELADQGLRATLSAERPGTADMIRRHSAELTQQFHDAGFEDVDLNFADRHRDAEADSFAGTDMPEIGDSAQVMENPAAPVRRRALSATSGLDMRL